MAKTLHFRSTARRKLGRAGFPEVLSVRRYDTIR